MQYTTIYFEVLMRFYVIFKQPWYVLRPTCFASCSYDQLVAICAASHYVYVSSVETTTLIKNEFFWSLQFRVLVQPTKSRVSIPICPVQNCWSEL